MCVACRKICPTILPPGQNFIITPALLHSPTVNRGASSPVRCCLSRRASCALRFAALAAWCAPAHTAILPACALRRCIPTLHSESDALRAPQCARFQQPAPAAASAGDWIGRSVWRVPAQRALPPPIMARAPFQRLLCMPCANLNPTTLTEPLLDPRAGVNMQHTRCPSSPTPRC